MLPRMNEYEHPERPRFDTNLIINRLAASKPSPPPAPAPSGSVGTPPSGAIADGGPAEGVRGDGNAAPSLEMLMAVYKKILIKRLDRGDTSPEGIKQIARMVETVLIYQRHKARLKAKG